MPSLVWQREWIATFVGILSTTISPYLFFWQASQELGEEGAKGRSTLAARRGATAHELGDATAGHDSGRRDVLRQPPGVGAQRDGVHVDEGPLDHSAARP